MHPTINFEDFRKDIVKLFVLDLEKLYEKKKNVSIDNQTKSNDIYIFFKAIKWAV